MRTKEITIKMPADVLLAGSLTKEQVANDVRTVLAFKYFSEGRLSAGKASQLAGMTRIQFLFEVAKRGIDWLPYSDDELRRELT